MRESLRYLLRGLLVLGLIMAFPLVLYFFDIGVGIMLIIAYIVPTLLAVYKIGAIGLLVLPIQTLALAYLIGRQNNLLRKLPIIALAFYSIETIMGVYIIAIAAITPGF